MQNETQTVPQIQKDTDKYEKWKQLFCCHENSKEKKTKLKYTLKQKISLVMLAIAEFMSFCSMSIMAPFFPAEASSKGMTESMAGMIFGFYALIVFLSSPVFGKFLPRIGMKKLFIIGLFTSGVANISFGLLHRIDDYTKFATASFLIRGIEALGASAYSTSGFVIVMNVFPDNMGAVRGLLETFVGLGMSAGPGIGGVLFAIGGFSLPFYVLGSITIVTALLNMYILPTTSANCFVDNCGFCGFYRLIKIPSVLITCLIVIVTSVTWGFLDPTLEPHLRKFILSPGQIGMIFLLMSTMYGIFCPIWGWLTDKTKSYWWMMTIGLFTNSLVLLFLGPSSFLSFIDDTVGMNIAALSALGVSVSMVLMPAFECLLDNSLQNGFKDDIGTHSMIAGMWSCVYSLGDVIGPVVGGFLLEKFGFSVTTSTFLLVNLTTGVVAVLYLILSRKFTSKRIHSETATTPDKFCYIQDVSDVA